jgi:hypothetical protein
MTNISIILTILSYPISFNLTETNIDIQEQI